MSGTLKPPGPNEADNNQEYEYKEQDDVPALSRSPHPYHRQSWELLDPTDHTATRATSIPTHKHKEDIHDHLLPKPSFIKDSTPVTDSGTEADDEIFVKKLPAPRAKLHKGLRSRHEGASGVGTPLLTPSTADGDLDVTLSPTKGRREENEKRHQATSLRRNRVLVRRGAEVLILALLTWTVARNPTVRPFIASWKRESMLQAALFMVLLSLYPLRVAAWAHMRGERPRATIPLSITSSFDPAPALYPQLLPILVAFLTAANLEDAILPNLVLGIASIPRPLIPTANAFEDINPMHWLLTCLPVISHYGVAMLRAPQQTNFCNISPVSPQDLALLYPIHQSLSLVLYHLTTTSLLTAELQLLSISLINLLILSKSPQAVILQSILWVGGLGVLLSCTHIIRLSINLARIPKWRLRRNRSSRQPPIWNIIPASLAASLRSIPFMPLILNVILGCLATGLKYAPWRPWERSSNKQNDSELDHSDVPGFISDEDDGHYFFRRRSASSHRDGQFDGQPLRKSQTSTDKLADETQVDLEEPERFHQQTRRRTLHSLEAWMKASKTHTSTGRPKKYASSNVRFFYGLAPGEANTRKQVYAVVVYVAIVTVILLPVGYYVRNYATAGHYPIGWAVGYILGDLHWFRMQVVMSPWLDWAIALPDNLDGGDESCYLGWVEHLRHASVGEANMRLVQAAWWIAVIIVGLAVVFRLSPYYEVDTRRKIFHFMMVSMFLPAVFIDPTWCALALSVVLAIFLLLDLLRASQLPPLSKPIRDFLQPYTDGRDHQGPVVISHIFLLIGCAIPLWLSLASLPRSGTGTMRGWEIPTRELSMVAGVVCVGLGDAAASLIGRRYGRHKWYWRGGKSLEGSVAFAVAVFIGLMAANIYLRVGGWRMSDYGGEVVSSQGFDGIVAGLKGLGWSSVLAKTGFCASVSSLTEAVLTGGNDNVVVPVVLWTCVKSTGLGG